MTEQNKTHDVAVYIGRFQIFHNAQLALLRHALKAAQECIVVLGSAFQARTSKNPFTWEERAEMIRLALPEADRERLKFLPVRDYYDQARWVAAVKEGVTRLHPEKSSIVLVGHQKDATSSYLRDFPGWALDDAGSQGEIHASSLRDAYFGAARQRSLDAALAALVSQAPPSTLQFLRAWANLPPYLQLAGEWEALQKEKAAWAGSPYAPVFVTVDAVIQCGKQVLLIERGRAPGKGLLAVPGGFLEPRETAWQSALRELAEETGLKLLDSDITAAFKAMHVFDHPDRSSRGRVITHAHWFDLGPRRPPEVKAEDDAASAQWVPIADLPGLEDRFHDDHFHILDFFFGLTGGQMARNG
ncbi:MAG: NUDIX domain-containing protein [Comamonadaceae bacterium]|nr:MAG: NUDIX domain-containing protein [Comamonadaceae bacterium]